MSLSSSSLGVDCETLKSSIRDSFYKQLSTISDLIEGEKPIKIKLKECELLNRLGDPSSINVIEQVLCSFDLCPDTESLEEKCQKFLTSLSSLGEKTATRTARLLRKEWNLEANKLGLADFLSEETTHKEENDLMSSMGVKPFIHVPITPTSRRISQDSLTFKKKAEPRNRPAEVFQELYTEIVETLLQADLAVELAKELHQARLVHSAVLTQAEKAADKVIQAKTVIESVLTMIERSRKPEKQLKNFIAVLELFKRPSGFAPVFGDIIAQFSREGFWPENHQTRKRRRDRGELHHYQCLKQAKLDSSPERKATECQQQPQVSQNIPESFKHYLHSRYRKIDLRLRSGRSHQTRQERKFFSLEAMFPNEFKCSLDLRCLPQSDCTASGHPSRTLITGNAGVGKSSIAIELCKRWSDRALLQCYEYVILIRAKDCKAAHDLKDFIPRKEWRALIEETDGANSLFIIDGYDEFTEEIRKPDGFLDRFLQGIDVLPEASIIVTTRPWCAKQISPYFSSGEVEILGFTPESRKEYVTHHLGNKHADKILQAVPKHNNFASIPFILSTLVDIYNQTATQDHDHGTLTKAAAFETHSSMYGFLISTIVSYYAKRTDSLSKFINGSSDIMVASDGEFEFIKLPHHIYLPFLKLCILAYKSLLTPADVNAGADLQYDLETFDLFCMPEDPESDFRQNSSYKFLHYSVQEYLAAYCISRMEKYSMDVCMRNLRKSYRYQLIIEFLYGFGCIRDVTKIPAIHRRQPEEINSFAVLRQVCESKNSQDLIKDAFGRQEKCIIKRTYPHPSPHDFRCLGKVIAHSRCEWEMGFTYRSVTKDHLKMFSEGIRSNERPIGRITTMGLSFNDIDDQGLNSFIRLPKPYLEHVKELRLNSNRFTSAVIPDLCWTLEGKKFEKLEKFLFHHNYITPAGSHGRLIESLAASCAHLRHVSFTGLLPNECQLLLHKLKQLKVIELWQISTESCERLFISLPESNSIEELEIYQCNITHNTVKNLPQALPESKHLTCLKLNNCNIDDASSLVIANAAKAGQLQSLDLSNNVIGDLGGRNLRHLRDDYRIDLKDTYKCNNFSREIQLKLMPQQPTHLDPCFSMPATLTTGSRKRTRRYFSN